jgi:DNA invertase Pin-like site-specific DNA recombinase
LTDAEKRQRPFDAVIVADVSRWSRDNVGSAKGLELLRDAGVRFFVLTTEYDLFNPEQRMFLALNAVIGAYNAHTQTKKSVENKIARAKRGTPLPASFLMAGRSTRLPGNGV